MWTIRGVLHDRIPAADRPCYGRFKKARDAKRHANKRLGRCGTWRYAFKLVRE